MYIEEEKLCFRSWIIERYIKADSPRGDLARDIMRDINFPSTYAYDEMINYMKYIRWGTCKEALETFRAAYKSYKKYLESKGDM